MAMQVLHAQLFALIILILWTYRTKRLYAEFTTKTGEQLKQSHEILCGKEEVFSGNAQHIWTQKLRSDFMLYATADDSLCLNNATNSLFIRKCDRTNGKWSPPSSSIKCAELQKQSNKLCPEDLIEIHFGNEFICLKLSDDKRVFDESFCYGSDTLFGEKSMTKTEIKVILQYLSKKRGIDRFWLPVRRASYNKYYNPFVVRLPGYRWGDVYEIQDIFTDKECISAEIIKIENQLSFRIHISNCSETLTKVCIYRKDFVAYSGCPQGFGALAYKPNECYGIEWEAGLFPYDLRPLTINEYLSKKNSLQHIFYSIGLDRARFFCIGNFSDENKKHYNIEMNGKEKVRVVPFSGKRHALSCEYISNLNRKSVEMILSVNPQFGGLILTIYNRNYIWRFSDQESFGVKCFTNSESDSMQWSAVQIKPLWQNTLETKALFKIKQGKYEGYYWCEAHTVFDFSIVKTKKIAVSQQKRGHTYALILELPCLECHNLFLPETWKHQSKKAEKILSAMKTAYKNQNDIEDLEISNTRLMDILSIRNNGTLFLALIHVSAYLKSSLVGRESKQSIEESNNEETEFGVATSLRMKVLHLISELISPNNIQEENFVRSTLFCFPEKTKDSNFWPLSQYGQKSTTMKPCLYKTGLPIIRQCRGEFLWGAYWEKINYIEKKSLCIRPNQSDVITYELLHIEAKTISRNSPSTAVKNLGNLLERNLENLIPADFYYISRIMHTTMKSILKDNTLNTTINEVFSIEFARVYNYLMKVNKSLIKSSAMLNSTNVLLEAFERITDGEAIQRQSTKSTPLNNFNAASTMAVKNISKINYGIDILKYEDIGVKVKLSTNFLIFMLDPSVANVTGLVLYRNQDGYNVEENGSEEVLQGCFRNNSFKFIISDQSVDDLLYEDNLELATYIPKTLWNRLDEISKLANLTTEVFNSTRIVIKIYANDALFQEQENTQKLDDDAEYAVTGKIVSVSIPGHDKDLPEMLPLVIKTSTNNTAKNTAGSTCSYWNYDTWVSDGLTFLGRSGVDNSVILCGCTHLTPFAYLIGDGYKSSVDSDIAILVRKHEKVLDVITILGCSLSLFGVLGIFVTAAIFQSWRQKASSKVLLQLSGAISLQMVLFCFVNTEENSQQLMEFDVFSSCIAIGALLHYSVLVQFSWMTIIGYLQFKRYVQVFGNTRPKRFFKKSSMIGWGAPLIPVTIVLIFDRKSYIPNQDNVNSLAICYPSGFSLYLGIIFPITVIIIANFIIFSIILFKILRGPEGNLRHTEKGSAVSQLRLSALLFFLLGFTWVFGLLATLKAGIIFSYIFCLTATLQGFVIFIYFVILDPKTRRMWRGLFINIFGLKESHESSTSMKETIQTLR